MDSISSTVTNAYQYLSDNLQDVSFSKIFTVSTQTLSGFSMGYNFVFLLNAEAEVKQGKNYYLSINFSIAQQVTVANIMSVMHAKIGPYAMSTPISWALSLAPVIIYPMNMFFATVKMDSYNATAYFVNNLFQNSGIPVISSISIPDELSDNTVRVINFLVDNMDKVTITAFFVGAIGLIALESYTYVAGMCLSGALHVLDQMGYIPPHVNLFIQRYILPLLSIANLFEGALIYRLMTAIQFAHSMAYILPVDYFMSYFSIYDEAMRYGWTMMTGNRIVGFSLAEMTQPWVQRNQLSYDEMIEILDAPFGNTFNSPYKINAAHLSKPAVDLSRLQKSEQYDELLNIFDKIDWKGQNNVSMRRKLAADERFQGFVRDKLGNAHTQDVYTNIDQFLVQLARESGAVSEEMQTDEEKQAAAENFALQWTREQLAILVKVLKGEVRVVGSQQSLVQTLPKCQAITHLVINLSEQAATDPVAQRKLEDLLLKIAIEAGDYCADGLRRVFDEMIIESSSEMGIERSDDPQVAFEDNIKLALLRIREGLFQDLCLQIAGLYGLQSQVGDIHIYDAFRVVLLGFTPLSEETLKKFSLSVLFNWEINSTLRAPVLDQYSRSLGDAIENVGAQDFTQYMLSFLADMRIQSEEEIADRNFENRDLEAAFRRENNTKTLTQEQYENIIGKFGSFNNYQWTPEETTDRFQRLFFVKLGVLIPNPEFIT